MNKCRHCGVFVPIEKAFCPNCSEPIEPEEAPNRAASFTTDMMATMRDDPEHYKELLQSLKDKKKQPPAAAASQAQTPEPGPAQAPASAIGHNVSQIAPDTLPPARKNKRSLVFIIGAISFLILLFVILMTFKII
jgi:predicted nucleic acid-binding Zn ribbon protein